MVLFMHQTFLNVQRTNQSLILFWTVYMPKLKSSVDEILKKWKRHTRWLMRKKTWNILKRKREEDKSFVLIKIKLYTISGCSTQGLLDTISSLSKVWVMACKILGQNGDLHSQAFVNITLSRKISIWNKNGTIDIFHSFQNGFQTRFLLYRMFQTWWFKGRSIPCQKSLKKVTEV